MSRSDTLRNELSQLKTKQAALQTELSKQEGLASSARAAAARKRREAGKASSDSSRRTHQRSAEQQDSKVVAAEKDIALATKRLADNAKAQAAKDRSLRDALASEQRLADRQDDRRRRDEIAHARAVAQIRAPSLSYIEVPAPEPEKLRVLYLLANPEAEDVTVVEPDGTTVTTSRYLRLQHEVREVQHVLRGARYRDLVAPLELRPAATVEDLIDAMNDVRPHLVHFSGHASPAGVALDDGDLADPRGQEVTFSLLAKMLAATDIPPRVLVLNACETLVGAEALLPAVPVIIAMADSIDDTAAIVFARRFYAAVASAQSVAKALDQATAVMEASELDDADLPQLRVRDGVDADTVVLVRPPAATAPRDRSTALRQDFGLAPLSVRVLELVRAIEASPDHGGVLSTSSAAADLGVASAAVRAEVLRLMDGALLAAEHVETDVTGAIDLISPRLTVHGVAALAR